jgi:PAS domain-containing protein
VLIIWLLVGRDIVSRLTRLGWAMSAIAAGRLDVAIGDMGADEIGAMGRAVEAFRLVAIERDARLAERTALAQPSARNEGALRVIFDSLHQGVAIFDRNLTLVAWNQPFRDLLKLPDVFLESRPSFDDFYRLLGWRGELGPGDTEKKLAISRSAVDRPLSDERMRPDGSTLEIRRNPISGGGFVLMYTDITERKRAEAQIRRAKKEGEAALRELKATQADLIQAEKVAALSQLTGIAREIKRPVEFVSNFGAISVELMGELKAATAPALAVLTTQRERAEVAIANLSGNLERIALQGKRAEGIAQSMLAHLLDGSGERQRVELSASRSR